MNRPGLSGVKGLVRPACICFNYCCIHQVGAEYEELKQILNVVQKDLEVTNRNYHLTWQDLQKVTTERNQVSIRATR